MGVGIVKFYFSCGKIWLKLSPTDTHCLGHPSHLKFSLSFLLIKISLELEVKKCDSLSYWEQEIPLRRLPDSWFWSISDGPALVSALIYKPVNKILIWDIYFFLKGRKLSHLVWKWDFLNCCSFCTGAATSAAGTMPRLWWKNKQMGF